MWAEPFCEQGIPPPWWQMGKPAQGTHLPGRPQAGKVGSRGLAGGGLRQRLHGSRLRGSQIRSPLTTGLSSPLQVTPPTPALTQ